MLNKTTNLRFTEASRTNVSEEEIAVLAEDEESSDEEESKIGSRLLTPL